jgi:hypothetical protein
MPKDPLKTEIMKAAKHQQKPFSHLIGSFEDRGILNSEMLLVCSLAEELGTEIFIESGRWRGQSTEVLAQYFRKKPVSIESIELFRDRNASYVETKMKPYKNVRLHYGDANYLIPKLVRIHRGKKIAILFDGPKGNDAVDVFRLALTITPTILIGFFHDMRQPSKMMPNPQRKEMEKAFRNVFFSDDTDFLKSFSHLDETCLEELWQPYKIAGKTIGSYGPTLAAVIPSPSDYEEAKKDQLHLWVGTQKKLLGSLAIRTYHILRPSAQSL